jgi:hypothetical protein
MIKSCGVSSSADQTDHAVPTGRQQEFQEPRSITFLTVLHSSSGYSLAGLRLKTGVNVKRDLSTHVVSYSK